MSSIWHLILSSLADYHPRQPGQELLLLLLLLLSVLRLSRLVLLLLLCKLLLRSLLPFLLLFLLLIISFNSPSCSGIWGGHEGWQGVLQEQGVVQEEVQEGKVLQEFRMCLRDGNISHGGSHLGKSSVTRSQESPGSCILALLITWAVIIPLKFLSPPP